MKSFYDKAYNGRILCMAVDLETKDVRGSAQILSIGAVLYEIDTEVRPDRHLFGQYKEIDTFYVNIDPDTWPKTGKFTVGLKTMDWWFTQPTAFAQLAPDRRTAEEAIGLFYSFYYNNLSEETPTLVVGKPSHFDVPILENALMHVKGQDAIPGKVPWRHWEVFCLRTFLQQTRFDQYSIENTGTPHNALDDARWQAQVHTAAQLEFLKRQEAADRFFAIETAASALIPDETAPVESVVVNAAEGGSSVDTTVMPPFIGDPIGETPPPLRYQTGVPF